MALDPRAAIARAHMPEGTEQFLELRTLHSSHRRLAELLRPGMRVLDIGCGSGAITRGIAEAVGPDGAVLGIDPHAGLLARAKAAAGDMPQLDYRCTTIGDLGTQDRFDLVTASRVLQWLADPDEALQDMVRATKVGGLVVVLDYDHTRIAWKPDVPADAHHFYDAFLRWREEAGMDNRIAEHLPGMFAEAGLVDVEVSPQPEVTHSADPDFAEAAALWEQVVATRGHQLVGDGALSERTRAAAERAFAEWAAGPAPRRQAMHLVAVSGRRPPAPRT
ncbi:MAG TPA: methyltransferase domain-containing protein [Baekduia sp.]|jgi:SAM-dependent methyltransferase